MSNVIHIAFPGRGFGMVTSVREWASPLSLARVHLLRLLAFTRTAVMRMVLAAIVASLAVLNGGHAQSTSPDQRLYLPGLGDLMTMTVQPRHIKLALAGQQKNWTYAAYELHELEEAFERAARAWPQWQSIPIAQLITSATKEPIASLAQAIKAADGNRFMAAYEHLTDACNACHQAANRSMIVIRVPDASSFPDQDFQPSKP
jgi:hypothetical protein